MRRFLAVVAMLLGLPVGAQAAGSIVVTSTQVGNNVVRYDIDWTSSSGGAVSALPMDIVRGWISQALVVPDSGGTQPSDLYDLELQDSANNDLTQDAGDNLSNATSKMILFDPPIYYDGTTALELVVANAGNAKGGVFSLWIGPR